MRHRTASRSHFLLDSIFVTLSLSALSLTATATTLTETGILVASDAVLGDAYARSFDVDGDTIVVGALFAGSAAVPGSGAAYVYERNTAGLPCPETASVDAWCQQAKITADDAEPLEYFGEAVAIEGDTIFVGARRDDRAGDDPEVPRRVGSVYVFTRSGGVWTQQDKLIASDAVENEQARFGSDLAVDGDVLAVKASRDDEKGERSGAVYVFRQVAGDWIEQQKLTVPDVDGSFDGFGSADVEGDTIVVGAPGDDDAATDAGAAYVFVFDGASWVLQAKLIADDAAADDVFGTNVNMSRNSIIVGAPHFYESLTYSGAAYVFGRAQGQWFQQGKLVPSDGFIGDAYGFGVDIEGTTAIVTADRDDDSGEDTGSMYVYQLTPSGWVEVEKITASDARPEGWFGTRVEISGNTAVVSAWQLDDFDTNSGAVYTFEIDVDDDGIFDSLDNCPITPNADQADSNGNDVGDACDVGAVQTFSDGGIPAIENTVTGACTRCIVNGWTPGPDNIIEGEDGPGDNALSAPGNGGNYHFLSWRAYRYSDTRFVGDLQAPGAAAVRFSARHAGGADDFVLRIILADPFDDGGSDWAISNDSATISTTATSWQEYTIPLAESDMQAGTLLFDPYGFIPPRRTVAEIRANVAQFGFRHDAMHTGPGTPSPTSSVLEIDDIQILLDGDGDGTIDEADNCPVDANVSQSDIDFDGTGDVCDVCPSDATDMCDPDGSAAEEIDATTGGTVETPDGELELDIPPNALGGDTTVSITDAQPADPAVDLSIGPDAGAGTSIAAFDLGPDGLMFAMPISVTFEVDVTGLTAQQQNDLDVYRLNETTQTFEPLGAVCNVVPGPPDIADCTVEISSFSVYAIVAPLDSDSDGVADDFDGEADVCPNTMIPESVPTKKLNPDHWALTDADFVFDTEVTGQGSSSGYTTSDTAGCSCEQIIDAVGLGNGHRKHGCSNDEMLNWVSSH